MNVEFFGKKVINKISWVYSSQYSERVAVNLVVLLILIAGFFGLIYYQKKAALNYLTQAEEQRKEGHVEEALLSYEKAYKLASKDRDIVHGYVGGLIYFDKSNEAYGVISKYINSTPKASYWEDMDIWVDKAMTEILTKKCLDASTSAWHVLARTLEADEKNKIAGAIMSNALNEKDCIQPIKQ